MNHDLYIDSPPALAELCERLRGSSWLALDTEFIRERTYYPQLCLVQVANEALVACIDPLVLTDLDPLLEIIYTPTVTKVLHAAQQDLEIFFHWRGAVPGPVFDTQLAATLLDQGEQVGYAALVKALLGVELDKSQTRTDWSQRPLAPEQLAYAFDDVRYLSAVYRMERAELERLGRLDWLAEDFKALCDPGNYTVNPPAAWRRIKGAHRLRGVQLAVLRALAAWREEQAVITDRPRRWLLGDDALLELARRMPRDLEQLKGMRGLESVRRHSQAVVELIARARDEPPESWPRLPARQPLTAAQEALVDVMMAVVRLRGAQKGVSPQALASRKDLERLLGDDPDVPLLHGWRAALAGREVQALLRGEVRLEVRDGELGLVG